MTCQAGQECEAVGLLSSLPQIASTWPWVAPRFPHKPLENLCLQSPGFVLTEFLLIDPRLLFEPKHLTAFSLLAFSVKNNTSVSRSGVRECPRKPLH